MFWNRCVGFLYVYWKRMSLRLCEAAEKISLMQAWKEQMGSLPLLSFNSILGYFHLHLRAMLFEHYSYLTWKENPFHLKLHRVCLLLKVYWYDKKRASSALQFHTLAEMLMLRPENRLSLILVMNLLKWPTPTSLQSKMYYFHTFLKFNVTKWF